MDQTNDVMLRHVQERLKSFDAQVTREEHVYNLTKARLRAKLETIGIFLCLCAILVLSVVIIHLVVDLAFYVRSIL